MTDLAYSRLYQHAAAITVNPAHIPTEVFPSMVLDA